MSDVDISPETPNFLARVDYELSVEGRTSVLEGVGKKKFRWEDVASSRLAMIAGLRASLTATQEKLAAAEALFKACAVARDNVGFVGTVPDCIACMDAQLTTAQAKFVALAFAVENGRRGAFSDDKTEALVDKVLSAQAHIEAARNEALEEARKVALKQKWPRPSTDGERVNNECCNLIASEISALKSTTPAPVRDDARDDSATKLKSAVQVVLDYKWPTQPMSDNDCDEINGLLDDLRQAHAAFLSQDKDSSNE